VEVSLLKWLSRDRGDAGVDNHIGGKRKMLSAEEKKLDVKFQVATGTSAVQMESINNTQSQQDTEYPDCWSDIQYKYFTEENKWLVVRNKKLGCSVCAEVSKLGMGHNQELGLSLQETGQIVRLVILATQQLSLRKKISEHKKMACHKKRNCTNVCKEKVFGNRN
jgi:hypothetical protein